MADRFPEMAADIYPSFTAYTARDSKRTKHSIAAIVWKPDEEESELRFSISYLLGDKPGRGGSRKLHREPEFLNLLRSFGSAKSMAASVEFRFNIDKQQRLAIPLPLAIGGGEGLPRRAEIRGLRVVIPNLTDVALPELSMIIDRPLSEDVHLDIKFDLPSNTVPIEEAPNAALKVASGVARSFVQPS